MELDNVTKKTKRSKILSDNGATGFTAPDATYEPTDTDSGKAESLLDKITSVGERAIKHLPIPRKKFTTYTVPVGGKQILPGVYSF